MRNLTKIYNTIIKSLRSDTLVEKRTRELGLGPDWEILAIGKAAATMTSGALKTLHSETPAFVLTKHGHTEDLAESSRVEIWQGGHPLPDLDGRKATQALLAWTNRSSRRQNLLILLSGGASSLLVSPSPPLDLESLIALNKIFLASGLAIEEINVIRKHISMVKGGQLGCRLLNSYRTIRQLAVCDISSADLGRDEVLSLIGSGPAVADPSTLAQASQLLEKLTLEASLKRTIENSLRETPKSLDIATEILADHRDLQQTAERLIPQSLQHSQWQASVQSDIAELAPQWADLARTSYREGHRGTLIATGEPTVRLGESPGLGGRCQELALLFARAISGEYPITLLAGSSDGTDGPTEYAGAVVDNTTWEKLVTVWGESELSQLLEGHNSSKALEALPETLLLTGPTGQNINDLFMLDLGD